MAAGAGADSKWSVTREALKVMILSLPDEVAVGLLGYPNRVVSGVPGVSDECVAVDAMLPVQPLASPGWRAVLADGLDSIQTEDCSPTHDAYLAAVGAHRVRSSPMGEQFVLLITDGVPTLALGCSPGPCRAGDGDEQAVIDEILRSRAEQGVETLVLRLPGTEVGSAERDGRWWLSMAADAGGTPALNCTPDGGRFCHLDTMGAPSLPVALAGALGSVGDRLRGCAFALPTPPRATTWTRPGSGWWWRPARPS